MSEPITTYTQQYTVYRHDGDHHGNVKPGALLRYGQQIATIHAEAVGLNDALYAKPTQRMFWPSRRCILTARPV